MFKPNKNRGFIRFFKLIFFRISMFDEVESLKFQIKIDKKKTQFKCKTMLSLYCIDNIKYIYYNIDHSIQTNSIEILSMTTFIRKHTTTNIKKTISNYL